MFVRSVWFLSAERDAVLVSVADLLATHLVVSIKYLTRDARR